MEAYIRGIGNISPQNTLDNRKFLSEIVEHNDDYLKCIEPVYKEYIEPNMVRRMGRIIKMGVVASRLCMNDAKVEKPDAIITGTGLGCIEDTEKFLASLINCEEQFLTPTSFIQSTHNAISGQIALIIKANCYNYAYVHRGFSFESALLDAMMLIDEGEVEKVLLGGVDEITPTSFAISKQLGFWKKKAICNLDLLKGKSTGSVAGEGAAFFMLANKESEENYAKIKGVSTIYKPDDFEEIECHIDRFLKNEGIEKEDIDLIMLGINGDEKHDKIYYHLQENFFDNIATSYYKHLCGEYHTSSAFGLWLTAKILKTQHIP